jgi:hypothetical protein
MEPIKKKVWEARSESTWNRILISDFKKIAKTCGERLAIAQDTGKWKSYVLTNP